MALREVLLIDDSEPLRDAFRLLVSGRGYEVSAFASGHDALAYLAQHHEAVGLIVLDLEMPAMSGFQFLAERERSPEVRRIPVVVLTALAGPHPFEPGQVEEVLQKPVASDRLLELIRERCGSAASTVTGAPAARAHKSSGVQTRVMHGADFDDWYRTHKTRRTAE